MKSNLYALSPTDFTEYFLGEKLNDNNYFSWS